MGDSAQKQAVAERCLAGASVTGLLPATTVVVIGERLQSWVDATYPGATWATEIPVTGPRGDGGQWIGTIDLLLTLENGELVIIDHKSAPIRRDQAAAKASEFGGQLAAYREMLQRAGEQVAAAHIHFSLSGAIVQLPHA